MSAATARRPNSTRPGRDWRAYDAVPLEVGPVLHLDDAVGSKTTALLGRALPRDFIDVAAALAVQQLDRLQNDQFRPYQLTGDDITALRERFASWRRDAASDLEAHVAYEAVHPAPPTAAEPRARLHVVRLFCC